MSETFQETLDRFSDLNLLNFFKYSERGIEKESLRVNGSSISTSDHPKKFGAALTNPHITTDFSEALLEVITGKRNKIDDSINDLEMVLAFCHQNTEDIIWPGSIPCSIEDEDQIRIAEYGTSNSAKLKELYRKGLSMRYGSMMQCVSGIHYNFSLSDGFFDIWNGQNGYSKDFQNKKYLSLVRNFRRNAWLLLYLFGASPVVPNSFIGKRKNFLDTLNREDSFLEYATSLRMSQLGYMSEAQDDLHIAYNSLEEYTDNLKLALTKQHPPYQEIGIKDGDDFLQINDCIIQIENEYYSSIRPKRVVGSGERPINILKEKGIEYVEVRCMDNNPFLNSSIDKETAYFIEAFLMTSLMDEEKPCLNKEIKEIQNNWQSVVKEGRKPNLDLKIDGKSTPLKDAANIFLEKMKRFASSIPEDGKNLKENILKSIKTQEEKIINPDITPSGRIMIEMAKNDWTWEEFNKVYFKKNKEFFNEFKKDLSLFDEATKKSFLELKEIESKNEVPFENFLKEYLSSI